MQMLMMMQQQQQLQQQQGAMTGEMVVDGFIPLSEKPGIGVDINEEAMRQYAPQGVPFFA